MLADTIIVGKFSAPRLGTGNEFRLGRLFASSEQRLLGFCLAIRKRSHRNQYWLTGFVPCSKVLCSKVMGFISDPPYFVHECPDSVRSLEKDFGWDIARLILVMHVLPMGFYGSDQPFINVKKKLYDMTMEHNNQQWIPKMCGLFSRRCS